MSTSFPLSFVFALAYFIANWTNFNQPALADPEDAGKYKGRIEENSTIEPANLFFGSGAPSDLEILQQAKTRQEEGGLSLTTRKFLPQDAFEHLWHTYMQEGSAAYKQNRLSEAEIMYRAACKQAERFAKGDKQLAIAETNLGAVLRDEGKLEEAETVLKRALALKANS